MTSSYVSGVSPDKWGGGGVPDDEQALEATRTVDDCVTIDVTRAKGGVNASQEMDIARVSKTCCDQ